MYAQAATWENRSFVDFGDLVPFVVIVQHATVDTTNCCQALPVVKNMSNIGVQLLFYISVTQDSALSGQ